MINFKEKLLDVANFTPYPFQENSAWIGHLPFAAWIINTFEPKVFVELGSHWGHSYFSFCQAASESNLTANFFAVDTWQGEKHSGHYDEDVFTQVNAYNQEHYASFSSLLRMTFDDAASSFSDGSIDLLHIDGLHTYEAAKHDFETWLPKLAPGAIVLFHDTNVLESDFGVYKLWRELQGRYLNNLEFLHSYGLGVLQLDGASEAKKAPWLDSGYTEQQQLKDYFSSLGSKQLERFELEQVKAEIEIINQSLVIQDSQLLERDDLLAESDDLLAERDNQLAELYNSTSWKISRPLRAVSNKLKKIKHILILIEETMKQSGGLKNTLKKAIKLWQKEGLSGINRGLKLATTRGQFSPTYASGNFDRNDYAEWIRRYDSLTSDIRSSMLERMSNFKHIPLISVVMPVYNPNHEWLIEAIKSVQQQIYPHWEMCIADDFSTDPKIRPLLKQFAQDDSRIKVVFREKNGHISAASNSALELTTSKWIALLDHDDLLPEHALFWVADAINCNPGARLIYSDEDKVSEVGERHSPYFKCDWNRDLFYSHNMFCHFGVYDSQLLRDIGGFRTGLEGAQDYDLTLRCIEQVSPSQIYHIPRVLYHWRVHNESTAQSVDAKPYAMLAGIRALNEHFERIEVSAKAELVQYGYRIRYPLPDKLPLVSLIIPTYNCLELLRQCILSIVEKTSYANYEILIIDNGSDDPEILDYFESLTSDRNITIHKDDRPFNYSQLNNSAVEIVKGDIIALLNNDVEVISPEWLSEMVSQVLRPDVGAVGAKLWYPNNTLQHGGVVIGLGGVAGHSHKGITDDSPGYFHRTKLTSGFSAVTAACLVIQKSKYKQVNGLNEHDLKIAFNDVDFCLRLREAGYQNIWTPYAELYHHESISRGFEDTPIKQARFASEIRYMKETWGKSLETDPAYSPNLTQDHEDFSYAWPPRVDS